MQPCRSFPLIICVLCIVQSAITIEVTDFTVDSYDSSFTAGSQASSLCSEDRITDVNNLGFKFLNKLIPQQGNIFISPVGIAFNLGILYSAASNETANQIEKVLVRDESKVTTEKVEEELNQLLDSLRDIERNFSILNEIVFEDCKFINEDYVNTLKDNFVDKVKLIHYSEAIAEDFKSVNSTDSDSESILLSQREKPNIKVINSLAFNDSWKVQFLAERTKRDYFYSGKRETTEVWMMSIEAETFRFYEDHEMKYKFIELPYQSEHMSMLLALPTQYDQPANLKLDTITFCNIKSKLIPTKLDVISIPKFHFKEEISMKEELISMGITDAFNGTTAEFPGLSDDDGFHVSDVKQKINIEVDEDGTEAASITKLKFKPVAFRGVKEFVANHPFLFYVEDRKTGTILLSGRIDEPSESISFSEHLRF